MQALTYRVGHHSTSDDSGKYRKGDEMQHWKTVRDPVLRFQRWLEGQGWWDAEEEQKLRAEARKQVRTISTMTTKSTILSVAFLIFITVFRGTGN